MKRNAGLAPGVPLARNTPLSRTPWTRVPFPSPGAGRTRSAATRKTGGSGGMLPQAPAEFSPATKLLVRKRAGRGDEFEAQCEACGRWLGKKAGEFQHRAARGAGGCRDEVINGPANCAFMCPGCHRKAETRSARMGMDEAGFWIKHGTTPGYDPRNVPIMLHGAGGGPVVYLAADGLGPDGTGYLLQRPEAVAA